MCPINSLSSPQASSSLSKLNENPFKPQEWPQEKPGRCFFHACFFLQCFLLTLCSFGRQQKMKENRWWRKIRTIKCEDKAAAHHITKAAAAAEALLCLKKKWKGPEESQTLFFHQTEHSWRRAKPPYGCAVKEGCDCADTEGHSYSVNGTQVQLRVSSGHPSPLSTSWPTTQLTPACHASIAWHFIFSFSYFLVRAFSFLFIYLFI